MSGAIKVGLIIIIGVFALGWVVGLIKSLLAFLIPVAIFVGIGMIVFGLIDRKPLGGRRRRFLP